MKKYYRTKKYLVTNIYHHQKHNSIKKGMTPPSYSKDDLRDWLFSQTLFHKLYDNWKKLDFQKEYTPSVDRKDDYIGYTISNIQLMTWGENKTKYIDDVISEKNNKTKKSVIQLTKKGVFISFHKSITKASSSTNIHLGNISECCNKRRKTAGGFIWKFSNDKG